MQAVKNSRVKGDRVIEKKWTAFLRLKGQTWAKKEEEILDEFDGLVQSLRGVDIDYSIIIFVEGKGPRMPAHISVQGPETRVPRERRGA